jgi:hypothetical protein
MPCIVESFVAGVYGHHQDSRMPTEVVAETDLTLRMSASWQGEPGKCSVEGKALAC